MNLSTNAAELEFAQWVKEHPALTTFGEKRLAAALERAERERDKLGNALAQERARPGGTFNEGDFQQWQARAEKAERALAEMREALQACHDEAGGKTGSTVRSIARAALRPSRRSAMRAEPRQDLGSAPTPEGSTPQWKPMPQVESPDLEAVRQIAYELAYNMHFHEVVIANPFEAEAYVQDAGTRLMALVGWPAGFRGLDYGAEQPPAAERTQ